MPRLRKHQGRRKGASWRLLCTAAFCDDCTHELTASVGIYRRPKPNRARQNPHVDRADDFQAQSLIKQLFPFDNGKKGKIILLSGFAIFQ